jgi:hypothetical protein
MRMMQTEGVTRVFLSRRNLLALLHKLDLKGSMRTIQLDLDRGDILLVTAEDDKDHYDSREPGEMLTSTEQYITVNTQRVWHLPARCE